MSRMRKLRIWKVIMRNRRFVMIPCNRCKQEMSRDDRRDERRDVRETSPISPSEQLLGLSLSSPRRLAIEPRRWQRARSATRSPRHTVDCKAACQAPHGAETRPRRRRRGTSPAVGARAARRTRPPPSTGVAGEHRHARRGERRVGSTPKRTARLHGTRRQT